MGPPQVELRNPLKKPRKWWSVTNRPADDEYFLYIAKMVSLRATCPRAHVGCVIVDAGHRIRSTGYNGSEPGAAHCSDVGCIIERDKAGVDHCVRTTHAEVNAVNVMKATTSIDKLAGWRVYTTRRPCPQCRKTIIDTLGSKVTFVWA